MKYVRCAVTELAMLLLCYPQAGEAWHFSRRIRRPIIRTERAITFSARFPKLPHLAPPEGLDYNSTNQRPITTKVFGMRIHLHIRCVLCPTQYCCGVCCDVDVGYQSYVCVRTVQQ